MIQLEPTPAQWEEILAVLAWPGASPTQTGLTVWLVIRNIVLEAAAAKCGVVKANDDDNGWQESAQTCSEVIRALKGPK